MPHQTLKLRATVTKRQPLPLPLDMQERLDQLQHHQAAESAARQKAQDTRKPKQDPHELQAAFLDGNLGKSVTVFMINGIKLTGNLRQYDQFTILLQGPDGIESLVFKHAITTIGLTR